MNKLLLYLDPDSPLSLHSQIKQLLIDAILSGQIPAGERMSSTRQLAKQLGVSRNTLIAATQELIADGYLISRERSGCYVKEDVQSEQFASIKREEGADTRDFWRGKLPEMIENSLPHPGNWQQYPYLFIEGQFDPTHFPISEWRECARIVQDVREINDWAADAGDNDNVSLVNQIRTKLLPQRGISAQNDEILITSGAQQALALIAQLLLTKEKRIGVECPGYIDAHRLFEMHHAELVQLPVDEEGLVLNHDSRSCQLIYTTPSHQHPTTVTMTMDRRRALIAQADERDMIILEDDYAQESNFITSPSPALKSMDKNGRVIYFSSLSKLLAPGIRIGYMVASAEFIRQARIVQRLTTRHPASNNQRAAALFISLGHYDTLSRRLHHVHEQRWLELRRAVNFYFPQPQFTITPSLGGTSCWIQGPEELDVFELASMLQQRGILIDSPDSYLSHGDAPNCFRLSVTSIGTEDIRPGLEKIARTINEMLSGFRETLETCTGRRLTENDIAEVIPGAALIGETAYGVPYTAQIHPNGTIDIRYDNAARETDSGTWWVKEGKWWRQFSNSTYGEARGYYVALESNIIKWFDESGNLIDTELFIPNYEAPNLD